MSDNSDKQGNSSETGTWLGRTFLEKVVFAVAVAAFSAGFTMVLNRSQTVWDFQEKLFDSRLETFWTCHVFVPLQVLTYAAFASKAKGLIQPRAECLRRGL